MATTTPSNSGNSSQKTPTGRGTSASARRSTASSRRSTTRRSTSRRSTRSTTSSTPQTRVGQAQQLAERAILVPVGASLLAQENLVSTVRGLATKYRTRAGAERELKRYERRGATARNRVERQVSKTRTRFERELRHRRTSIQRSVKQNRRRLEREVRSVRKDPAGTVSTRAARLVANAQELIRSAS